MLGTQVQSDECQYLAWFLHFYIVQGLSPKYGLPTAKSGPSTAVNVIKIIPHGCVQAYLSDDSTRINVIGINRIP